FGTLAAKGVVRDVGRALDLPYAQCDSIAKMIPNDLGMTLEKALKASPDLRNAYQEDEQVKYLIDMSMRLEGLPRHTSMHAAGVVISRTSVDNYVPLSRASDGTITTQFTMTTLEELGLLKMDFLGLRTLTVIQNAVKQVNKNFHTNLDLDEIDYNDKKVLDSIGTGKNDGVFQLESSGMKSFMKELKPENLEDIIAGISLYRPGPMDFIPRYLKGKNDRASITYECPQLEPILSPTYGCIVYQEQVMQIVRDLAGYTLGRSDLLRRAMSKKKASVMEKERQNFVYGNEEEGVPGCVRNGIDEKIANLIYDEMTDFAKYAFNKSHAACYAVVSYQTAYLKVYYPKEFMAALMTSVMDNTTKISEYILTCRQMGMKILPPDINEGESGFSVSGDAIRYGLSAIKSVGKSVVEMIIAERENHGIFHTMEEFIGRMSNKEVNKRTLENFIKAGALDGLPGNRRQKLLVAPDMIDQKNKDKKNSMEGQISLFDIVGEEHKQDFQITFPKAEEFGKEDLLAFEKETLGIYVSGHPLEAYEGSWRANITAMATDFMVEEETERANVEDGSYVTIGGMITGKTVKTTKNNKMMAFVTLEDLVGSVEVVIFPRDYEKNRAWLIEDAKVFVQGRV
ncbi:MAG: DNA polymerase III subunit alpha, partial [Hungatella sp.]